MTRKEVVLLVSRALSISFGVYALIEVTYLPERLHSYVHYVGGYWASSTSDSYLGSSYRISAVFLFLRIAIYLVLALVFWKCGPWVERTLTAEKKETDEPAPSKETTV